MLSRWFLLLEFWLLMVLVSLLMLRREVKFQGMLLAWLRVLLMLQTVIQAVGMERFDTDHDIDGSDGVDREIFGSHYVMGNEFKVRIPASYADKPEGVFGFGFSGVSGGAVFSAWAVGGVLV